MTFGLTNAPATFQRTMDILLVKFIWETCLVCVGDIITFRSSLEEHIDQIDKVLQVLQAIGVQLKLRKCELFVERIKYLGRIVRPGTI